LKPDHYWSADLSPPTEYLSSRSNLKPELPSQYDWHVQPDCQRPNRIPPERRALVEFVPPSPSDFRTVLETLQTYRVHSVTVNLWILWKLLNSTSQGALRMNNLFISQSHALFIFQ
jgi:hypothetical protein